MDKLIVLSALAEIKDIQDFRLRDVMRKLGLDEKQPSTFYRELLKESRDALHLISDLQNRLAASEKAKCQAETKVSSQQRQIADLGAKTSRLQSESQKRINGLESDFHELEDIASRLLKGDKNYEGIKGLLQGRGDIDTLSALCDLASAMYKNALIASISGKHELEAVDLRRLAAIREQLREDLMTVLQIPRDVLEKRLMEAEKTIEAFKFVLNWIYGGKG
jgi:hypothetical protein